MDWRRLRNDETMMSGEDQWALTAAGSAILQIWVRSVALGTSAEMRSRQEIGYHLLLASEDRALNKRSGTFFPQMYSVELQRKGIIGMLALANRILANILTLTAASR